jgi:hypothetical protein
VLATVGRVIRCLTDL